jgi:hypothetical protein
VKLDIYEEETDDKIKNMAINGSIVEDEMP